MTKVTRGQFLTGAIALAGTFDPKGVKAQQAGHDLRPFERWIVSTFEPSVRVGPAAGQYARKAGEGLELYGVADMASILYSLNRLTPNEKDRRQWAEAFRTFQRSDDGWLIERSPTHDPLHNTAYAIASMQLLDLRPARPVKPPANDNPNQFLATIDWDRDVYMGSHRGAGLGAIRYNIPELNNSEWFSSYFAICDSLFDPRNGMMGRNKPAGGDFDQIGGTFHYGFLYDTFRRRMPFPEARIDAVLGLQQPDGYWHSVNHLRLTLDAIYLMTRTLRYTTHRYNEVVASIRKTLTALMADTYSDEGRVKSFNGKLPTHSLVAAVSILAEAQLFLGSAEIITDRPLRLVLDRRPFI